MKRSLLLLSILTLFYYCSTAEEELTENVAPAVKTYKLTVEASDGGTVSSSGGNVNAGSNVSITATPNSGYLFSSWSNGSTDNPISITVNSDQTLTANFTKRSYPLSINIIGEGTVTEEVINTGKTTDYEHGTTVRLTAVPNDGWGVTKWKGAIESKNATIDIVVNEDKEVTIEFHERYVPVYRGLTYDYPNNTTSKAIEQSFKQPKNIKDSLVMRGMLGESYADSIPPNGQLYMQWEPGIEFDFNNDGNIDYFAFMTANYPYGSWGVNDGIYMLIDDVFNPTRQYKYFLSNGHNFEFTPELLDINNDGIYEILAGNQNSHALGDGSHGVQIPPRVHYFDDDGNMSFQNFIDEPRGQHDFAIGDVDNDGDRDVLWWEYTQSDDPTMSQEYWNENHYGRPFLYLNDGNGNFIEQGLEENFPGISDNFLLKDLYENGGMLAWFVDLFDFDGDGNLDIIAGKEWMDNIPENQWEFEDSGIRIFWGNGKGVFDFNNFYDLPNETIVDFTPNQSGGYGNKSAYYPPFGGAYFDFDKDGDMDIVLIGQTDYSTRGWWILFFEQTNRKIFKDVTKSKLGNRNPVEFFDRTFGHAEFDYQDYAFPTKDPFVIDVDGDGDYDILPIGPAVEADWGYVDNYYFENIDGVFYERWYNDPEE